MPMGDIDDATLGWSGIRCTKRTVDIAHNDVLRTRICHFIVTLAGFAANLPNTFPEGFCKSSQESFPST